MIAWDGSETEKVSHVSQLPWSLLFFEEYSDLAQGGRGLDIIFWVGLWITGNVNYHRPHLHRLACARTVVNPTPLFRLDTIIFRALL
jgi:hypothetical protein